MVFYSFSIEINMANLPWIHSLYLSGIAIYERRLSAKLKTCNHMQLQPKPKPHASQRRKKKKKKAKCSACLRGDLKTIFTILFPWVNPSEDDREQIQPCKKYKHSSPRPSPRFPLLPHTDRKNWPHQVLEVIGYPLKHLNTTWRSNAAKHTHTHTTLTIPPRHWCLQLS